VEAELPNGRERRHDAIDVGNLAIASEAHNLPLAYVHLGEG
jgi:hypothetical protein